MEVQGNKYTDETPIPFGKHKGTRLIDIPGSWLLDWDDNGSQPDQKLKDYIEDNRMVLLQENDLNKISNGRY